MENMKLTVTNPDAFTYYGAFGIPVSRAYAILSFVMASLVDKFEKENLPPKDQKGIHLCMKEVTEQCNSLVEVVFASYKLGEWMESAQNPNWKMRAIVSFKDFGNKIPEPTPEKIAELEKDYKDWIEGKLPTGDPLSMILQAITGHGGEA